MSYRRAVSLNLTEEGLRSYGPTVSMILLALWLPVSMALAAGPQVTIDSSYKHEKKFMRGIGVTVTKNMVGKKPYRGGFWDTTPAAWAGRQASLRPSCRPVQRFAFRQGQCTSRGDSPPTAVGGEMTEKKVQVWIIDMGSKKHQRSPM